jgi:hypothetical protein
LRGGGAEGANSSEDYTQENDGNMQFNHGTSAEGTSKKSHFKLINL